MITYRNLKAVDYEKFSAEGIEKFQHLETCSFGDKILEYNKFLKEMLEDYAPQQNKTIKVVPNAPWFDTEYKELRKRRRKAEKQFKRSKSIADKECFVALRKQTTELAALKKRTHCTQKIQECNGSKALFNCVNILLDQKKPSILPAHDSKVELASRFNKYFKDKISDIRKSFPPYQSVSDDKGSFTGTVLDTFEPATEEEIRSLISTHGIKCSPEDPIPASL